jgi:osmoprotectant transport system ATP-binding protein
VPQPVVCFHEVKFEIGGRRILDGLSFDLHRGETLVLLGRSGSGKSTALRMVNAMLFPTSGEVHVDGVSTRDWDPIELRLRTGYAMQEVGLFPHLTVNRNVAVVPELQGLPEPQVLKRVAEWLRQVGLPQEEFGARYPRQLSGGQRQRVGVARALAGDPPLLLFDEPFGALDPLTRLELQRLFLDLRARFGKTSLFVTHDVREALVIGNRIALLSGGRLTAEATPAEFPHLRGEEVKDFQSCLDLPGEADGI